MIWNTSVNLGEQYIYISKLWSSFIRVSILLAFGMKVPVEGKIREFTRYYFEENYTSRDNKSKKDSILSVTRKVVSKKIFQKSTTGATMSCFNEERKKRKKGKEQEKNNRPRYTFRIVFHRAAINSMDRRERRREERTGEKREKENGN